MNKRKQQRGDKSIKQQKIIYKGMYISNQRRKGNGGRIKSELFNCKIQVMDFNPAIHQSQVEWVEIRRYKRGQKRQPVKRNNNKQKDFKKNNKQNQFDDKNGQNKNNDNKPVKKFKLKQNPKVQQQPNPTKATQTKQPVQFCSQPVIPVISQPKSQNQANKANNKQQTKAQAQNLLSRANQSDNNHQSSSDLKKQLTNQDERQDQQQIPTESQDSQQQDQFNDEKQKQSTSDIKSIKSQTVVEKQHVRKQIKKTLLGQQGQQGQQQDLSVKSEIVEGQKQKEKQPQEVIVARIIKQTKIPFKDRKFVGILTCQKKKNTKSNFIEKDVQPINKICQDYYLDVTPIHSRLPKMQLDSLVKENVKVLNDYVQKTYPEKGKQLTKKKLNQILDVIESIYVVVSFSLWQGSRPYANIHQVIGKTMTIDGQCNCFLFEHHLNDFTYEQIQQKNTQVQKIQVCPTQHHKPFNKMVFSIDPASSVDLDDALSIQHVQGDIFEIGIHIADVTEYLKYIKREQLIKRTTSVYLPHKVFHMLTKQVMKISSLNQDVERLAFSIYVKMNLNGQLLDQSRIEKNIIKSRFKLSYQTVQDIITAKTTYQQFVAKYPNTSTYEFDTLVQKLGNLTKIGIAHRQKRIKFEVFENRQIHFALDKDKWPVDISVESRFTSKKIVQQYMIIGNVEAAKYLIKNFRQNALIIYHPKPSDLSVKMFNETFKFLEIKFEFEDIHQVQQKFLQIQNNKQISEQVKQYLYFKGRRVQQTAGYKLYHEAVKEILQKAINKQEPVIRNVHFALGEDFYTHFTSPMRRMADILVHQTLNSLIYKTQPKPISAQEIEKINEGRKHTKRLKKDLTQMYICLMIHKTGKKIQQDGIITSFGLKSVSIYIPYFDMVKQIIWRDQLQLHRVSKNRQNQDILDVCIYYDRKFPSRDIIWKAKKYQKVKLIIDCTKRPPLRLSISLQVISTKDRKQIIHSYNPDL